MLESSLLCENFNVNFYFKAHLCITAASLSPCCFFHYQIATLCVVCVEELPAKKKLVNWPPNMKPEKPRPLQSKSSTFWSRCVAEVRYNFYFEGEQPAFMVSHSFGVISWVIDLCFEESWYRYHCCVPVLYTLVDRSLGRCDWDLMCTV